MKPEFEGKSLVELLDMLAPVPEPERISMMPQTAGWLIVAAFALLSIAFLALRLFRRHQANAYRRAALAELKLAGNDPARIATLLRRTALVAYPRAEVASLTGTAWTEFLDQNCKGAAFASDAGLRLVSAPYVPTPADASYSDMARNWILGHQRRSS